MWCMCIFKITTFLFICLQIMERNANDNAFISGVLKDPPQAALSLLLAHLPLLRPGNKSAAKCYLLTVQRLLSEFITPACKIYNECVEIMSYVFVHPAFDREDKKTFKNLLKKVCGPIYLSVKDIFNGGLL